MHNVMYPSLQYYIEQFHCLKNPLITYSPHYFESQKNHRYFPVSIVFACSRMYYSWNYIVCMQPFRQASFTKQELSWRELSCQVLKWSVKIKTQKESESQAFYHVLQWRRENPPRKKSTNSLKIPFFLKKLCQRKVKCISADGKIYRGSPEQKPPAV